MTVSTRPLRGKRAMVTGSTSGIGLGIARSLANVGADVTAYVASKHGVLGLTKVVALETATTGFKCNAICQ